MIALSIRQPWAWLIVHGGKDIENRTWSSTFRGAFLVHAGKGLYGTALEREFIREWVRSRFGIVVPGDVDLQRGGIIGRAELVDVVSSSSSHWFEGPQGFVLDRARPLPFAPCNGRLGFFDVEKAL